MHTEKQFFTANTCREIRLIFFLNHYLFCSYIRSHFISYVVSGLRLI